MTDRYHALTVVLDADYRSDDAEQIINAIRQIRGVLSVEPHVTTSSDYAARARVCGEISKKLWQVLHPTPSSAT